MPSATCQAPSAVQCRPESGDTAYAVGVLESVTRATLRLRPPCRREGGHLPWPSGSPLRSRGVPTSLADGPQTPATNPVARYMQAGGALREPSPELFSRPDPAFLGDDAEEPLVLVVDAAERESAAKVRHGRRLLEEAPSGDVR